MTSITEFFSTWFFLHGGAWKVVHADFVTWMMSLFLSFFSCGFFRKMKRSLLRPPAFFISHKAGVPKSTPVEQKDASLVVWYSNCRPFRFDYAEYGRYYFIDIDVLHRIAQDWYKSWNCMTLIQPFKSKLQKTSEGLKVVFFMEMINLCLNLLLQISHLMARLCVSWLLANMFWCIADSLHDLPAGKRPMTVLGKCLYCREKKVDALNYYSAGDPTQIRKNHRAWVHKPNDSRFPNQPSKRRVELSLVLDLSKRIYTKLRGIR